MKAMEYAERLKQADNFDEALKQMALDFHKESVELLKQRTPASLDGFAGVFVTLDQKWQAVARRDNRVGQHGFRELVISIWPLLQQSKHTPEFVGIDDLAAACRWINKKTRLVQEGCNAAGTVD